jgi:hypothetical protein
MDVDVKLFRYSYAVVGVGFFILVGGILLALPEETTTHPRLMQVQATTPPTCIDNALTVPALSITDVPSTAQSLVLTAGTAVVYGIPPDAESRDAEVFSVASCSDTTVTLYATDITLAFIKAPTQEEVLTAIAGHVLERNELAVRTVE